MRGAYSNSEEEIIILEGSTSFLRQSAHVGELGSFCLANLLDVYFQITLLGH